MTILATPQITGVHPYADKFPMQRTGDPLATDRRRRSARARRPQFNSALRRGVRRHHAPRRRSGREDRVMANRSMRHADGCASCANSA